MRTAGISRTKASISVVSVQLEPRNRHIKMQHVAAPRSCSRLCEDIMGAALSTQIHCSSTTKALWHLTNRVSPLPHTLVLYQSLEILHVSPSQSIMLCLIQRIKTHARYTHSKKGERCQASRGRSQCLNVETSTGSEEEGPGAATISTSPPAPFFWALAIFHITLKVRWAQNDPVYTAEAI